MPRARETHASMTYLPRVASLIFDTPLLVMPETALAIAANLSERLGLSSESMPASVPHPRAFADEPDDGDDAPAPYSIHDGIATIAIRGELVNRGSWLSAFSGLVSYEGLSAALRQAGADPQISGIVLDIDSPGGQAAGAMETAAVVREVAGIKPVKAFVNSLAASAGYAIAAAASDVTVTPSSTVGSIGVVMLHLDRSGANDRAGVKPTMIHAGAYKVDGHSAAPLDDEVRARLQARIDATYDLFVDSVAQHRPMTDAAIRSTEAGLFMGAAAVKIGLADSVGTLDDVLGSFPPPAAGVGAPVFPSRGFSMTAPIDTISRATHDTALAAARAEGHAEGLKAGTAGERERISAILDHSEAEGRSKLARHLAFVTDTPLNACAGLLAASAKEAAAVPAAATHRLDGIVPQPRVGADVGVEEPRTETERGAQAFARVLGRAAR